MLKLQLPLACLKFRIKITFFSCLPHLGQFSTVAALLIHVPDVTRALRGNTSLATPMMKPSFTNDSLLTLGLKSLLSATKSGNTLLFALMTNSLLHMTSATPDHTCPFNSCTWYTCVLVDYVLHGTNWSNGISVILWNAQTRTVRQTPYSWLLRYGSCAISHASATVASRANWYTSSTADNKTSAMVTGEKCRHNRLIN